MQAPTAPLGRGMTGRAQTILVRHHCMHMRRLLIRAASRGSMGELALIDVWVCLVMGHLALFFDVSRNSDEVCRFKLN